MQQDMDDLTEKIIEKNHLIKSLKQAENIDKERVERLTQELDRLLYKYYKDGKWRQKYYA